ncbi:glycosyltransferase family 2 protein [uncultured Sphingomonas sp.]|uniref:glycosyltransferase family 2 protein n=1 Tax=uncultured Sphingomonas sp. TaxID=158754 RepID=UPI0035CB3586
MTPDISIVCPCYNEEANVEGIAAAVIAQLEACEVSFEYLFIDNASTDQTVSIIEQMCARDPRIKLIANTRNFGQMRSPTHCIYATVGRAVIGIASDFQDPPELIPEFIRRWRAGAPIVLGTRIVERSSWWLSLGRKWAYGFLKRFGDYSIVPHATGFGLYDRKVVDLLASLNEPEPFFRGLLVETGYRIETVPHARAPRVRGISSNTFFRMVDFALSGLAGSAKKLLRAPLFLALFSLVLAGIAGGAALLSWRWGGPTGWLGLLACLELNAALLFLFLGLLGDQVRLISERTRGTPLVVERERINFTQD